MSVEASGVSSLHSVVLCGQRSIAAACAGELQAHSLRPGSVSDAQAFQTASWVPGAARAALTEEMTPSGLSSPRSDPSLQHISAERGDAACTATMYEARRTSANQ